MKKLLTLLLVAVTTMLFMFSCAGGNTDSNQNGSSGGNAEVIRPSDIGVATVYAPGDSVQIISASSTATASLKKYLDAIVNINGGKVIIGSQYSQVEPLEILFGVANDKTEDLPEGKRPIIDTATAYMNRVNCDGLFEMRYAIYADSGKIAIVYDTNEITSIQPVEAIVDILASKIFTDKKYVAVSQGLISSGVIDLIEEQNKIDEVMLEQRWDDLEAVVGKEAADAFRKLYTMYDDRVVEWAANLYDPGVGGFYSCASGRDGAEFGPDVECTSQIIRFFIGSGMTENIGSKWTEVLPEFMQQRLIYFAKSLQDPNNGYFYHPQWGKERVDASLSRRGRDLGWACGILKELGQLPTYKAPTAAYPKYDGITADMYWDALEESGEAIGERPYSSTESPRAGSETNGLSALTTRLGSSAAVAVSKIVSVASENPDEEVVDSSTAYLKSHTGFINYLLTKLGPAFDSNPYSAGNTTNATNGQIADASDNLGVYYYTPGDENTCTDTAKALIQLRVNLDDDKSNDMTLVDIYKWFDGLTIKEILIKMLNEKINPEFGLWGVTSEKNPTGTEFLFTNGFFKTIGTYNSWRVPYPPEYIDDAANALMTGLMGDEPSTTNICEVYNIWTAIDALQSNLQYIPDDIMATDKGGNLVYDEYGNTIKLKVYIRNQVDTILAENMAAAVSKTYDKVSGYRRSDGGFTHQWVTGSLGSYATQQGLPTGIRLADQSNVDATCIGSTGLTREIFAALELSSYKIPLFTEADWMRALEVFYTIDPVVKYSYEGETVGVDVHDYEYDIPESGFLKFTAGNSENTFTQTKLGTNGVGVLNKASSTAQAYLDWKINNSEIASNTVIFETDIMLRNLTGSKDQIEIRLYDGTSSSGNRLHTLYITFADTADGSEIRLSSKQDKNNKVAVGKVGEWFSLSFEYCYGDGTASAPTAFKVYANGGTTPIIVSESFEAGEPVAVSAIGFARFITMKSFAGQIYLDNTRFVRENKEYNYDAPTSAGGSTPSNPSTPSTPSVTPVDKHTFEQIPASNYFTFTNDGVEDYTFGIVEDGDHGSVGLINKPTAVDRKQAYADLKLNGAQEAANAVVFELDLKFKDLEASAAPIELRFYAGSKSTDTRIYNLCIDLSRKAEGETIYVMPKTDSNKKVAVGNIGEWFHLKLVYYQGDGTAACPSVFKVYINDSETPVIVDEKFENGTEAAASGIALARLLTISSFRGKIYMDNLSFTQVVSEYKYDAPTHNVAAPPVPEGPVEVHDYESILPGSDYLKVTGASVSDFTRTEFDGKSVALLDKFGTTAQAYLDWKPNKTLQGANAVIFETEILFTDLIASPDRIELRIYAGATAEDARVYSLYIGVDGLEDGSSVYISPKSAATERVEIGKVGEWIKIKLVYFAGVENDDNSPAAVKVYINDSTSPVIVDQKLEVENAPAADSVLFSRFITMKTFVGKIYLDNTRFVNETLEYLYDEPTHNKPATGGDSGDGSGDNPGTTDPDTPAPEEPDTPTTPEEPEADQVLSFENINDGKLVNGSYLGYSVGFHSQKNAVSSATVVTDGEDKVLVLSKTALANGATSSSQTWLTVEKKAELDPTKDIYVEVRLKVSEWTERGSGVFFRLYSDRDALSSNTVNGTNLSGNISFDKKTGDTLSVLGTATSFKVGDWITIRVVCSSDGFSVYLKGDADESFTFLKTVTPAAGSALDTDSLAIMTSNTNISDFAVDYVYIGNEATLPSAQ